MLCPCCATTSTKLQADLAQIAKFNDRQYFRIHGIFMQYMNTAGLYIDTAGLAVSIYEHSRSIYEHSQSIYSGLPLTLPTATPFFSEDSKQLWMHVLISSDCNSCNLASSRYIPISV